jgi:hypothetical protein
MMRYELYNIPIYRTENLCGFLSHPIITGKKSLDSPLVSSNAPSIFQ